MTTPYTTGQISLVNGSALVTGVGTGWATSLIKGGFVFVEADGGNSLPLLPDDSATTNLHPITDTEMTAAIKWTGPTGTYDYALIRDTAYLQQLTANSQALANYTQRLNSTALSAVAGITPVADTLLLFTGPDTATTIALSGLINGADYDVQVNNLAGRAVYDSRPANFRVLVADIGDGRSAIYSKNSNTAADWSAPAVISGPPGPDGVNPRGNYDPATAYVADDLVYSGGSTWIAKTATTGNAPPTLPTTENTQWRIFARAGSAGVNPRGAYANGTTYAALDVVLDNGSSWIAKVTTTGNTPPVLPTTENAYWSLLAAKGTDGTGTGDVVGPASSVTNRVAVFGGTSGKVIIDSGVILGNSASRNVGTAAGTVAAGDDPRFSAGGQNDAILALEIADLKGSRLGMKGGVADAFDDETGVDVKTNAVYDATNDWYAPTQSSGTTAASATLNADGNTTTQRKYRTRISAAGISAGGAYIRVRVDGPSAGPVKTYTNVFFGRAASSGDAWDMAASGPAPVRLTFGGANSVTPPVGGSIWSDWVAFSLDNSFAHIVAFDGSATTGMVRYVDGAPTNYASWYKDGATDEAGTPDVTGYVSFAGVFSFSALAVLSTPPSQNMTLRSIAYAAAAVPTTGRVAIQLVESDVIMINTDVVVRMSRDGGATWATASLALSQSLVGPKMYEATGINLATLGSGTSMKWEVSTANNKNVAISGFVVQWS
ncbi:hypothetical protein [Agrobacterium cavarae]|uniref:hypothetical protein n=1 Tax=Agrobacterium cavarae TaxID=2528239 RepID=UPI003FD0CB79